MTNMYQQTGQVNTSLYCHNCTKTFIARIDFDLDGQHIVECPFCAHEHCRKIVNGYVTDERWDGHNDNVIRVEKRCVWKHDSLKMETSSASHFIRQKWLDRFES